jgi:anti-anti-sigma regulatory factor
MSDPTKPVFLVDAYSDPVVVRIEGRASFMNSGSLKDFFGVMLRQGRHRFIVDFHHCASMDSTFLGVLAGLALELRRQGPPARLTLARVGERNLELIRNLGLHRIALVDAGGTPVPSPAGSLPIEGVVRSELESAKLMLEAHENLVAADPDNATRFQDVLAFLRSRVESR